MNENIFKMWSTIPICNFFILGFSEGAAFKCIMISVQNLILCQLCCSVTVVLSVKSLGYNPQCIKMIISPGVLLNMQMTIWKSVHNNFKEINKQSVVYVFITNDMK